MNYFLSFFSLVFYCFPLIAQQTSKVEEANSSKKEIRQQKKQERLAETTRYFVLELMGTQRSVQDQATSNQIYDGFGGGIGFGGVQSRQDIRQAFRALGGYNGLTSFAGVTSHDFWGNFSYAVLRQLNKTNNYKFYLGGQADILSQVRYTPALGNSGLHWELVGSLGLATRYEQKLKIPWINKSVQVFGQAHLPLLAYVSRPIYGITIDGMMQHFIRPIGRIQRFDAELGMQFPIRKNNLNQFRISYQWDILRWRDNEVQRVLTGQHHLNFALLVKMI
ncbi:MAG: hypothetical protein AAF849_01260 [Bacteroidota bacterium]